jgi:hypothetical protein
VGVPDNVTTGLSLRTSLGSTEPPALGQACPIRFGGTLITKERTLGYVSGLRPAEVSHHPDGPSRPAAPSSTSTEPPACARAGLFCTAGERLE